MAAQTRSPMSVVELGHRQRVGEDDGHLEPARLQHLGHLQADVAAAEDDGPLRPGGDRGADVGAVGQPVHAVHAVGVQARDRRAAAGRPPVATTRWS